MFNYAVEVGHKAHRKFIFAATILIFCLLFIFLSYSQEKDQTKYFELDNGLKIFLYEKHTLPLINLVFAVNLGTKDESDETSGLVHILEHYILFRGTEFRSGPEISQDIRRHGAYFNAHTSLDLATFEISLPSEHADFALRNQKEILFNLKLSQKELDEEKKVILEEISLIHDDPLKYATSLVYQNLFKDHPYQKPIQGKKEIIEALTVEQIEKFYRKFFVPSNCALAIVGDFEIEEMEKKTKDIFGDLKKEEISPPKYKKVPSLKKTVEITQEMDVNQAYLVIGIFGPAYNNKDQYTIHLLTEILGRGVNPMLNYPLRGRRNLVHNVSMQYSAYKYGGAILIYITLEPKNIRSAKRETINFLKKTRSQDYSKKDIFGDSQFYALDFLESAKNQIKFKIHQSQEKGLLVAASLARFMLLNEDPNQGSYLENIEKISSSDLRKAAGAYLSTGRYAIVSIIPKKKK
ncbi:MAG TPA: insulinase family protein [Candidatus Aminicenantes bacterium]|nr:insulinase family protein [Candidatus Aminicenantes bacterium]